MRTAKVSFANFTSVTFGPHLRMGAGCQGSQACDRGLGLSDPRITIPDSREERGAGDRAESPMANDLISCTCVINSLNPKVVRFQGLSGWLPPGGMQGLCPWKAWKHLPTPCPAYLSHLAVPKLHHFIINQLSSEQVGFLSSVSSSNKVTQPKRGILVMSN